MSKNKKLLLIFLGALIVVLLIVVILIIKPKTDLGIEDTKSTFIPEFLNTQELERLHLPLDAKIQVLEREQSGDVKVYKIIKEENDVVSDPDKFREEWLETNWLQVE